MQRKYLWLVGSSSMAVLAVLAALHFSGNAANTQPTATAAALTAAKVAGNSALALPSAQSNSAATAKAATRTTHPLNSAVSNVSVLPLPPAGMPLKQTLADLKARADAGDAAAASRLFQDTQRCADVARINQSMNGMSRMLGNNTDTSQMSTSALQANDRMLGMMQKNLQFAQDNATLCAGLSADDMTALVPATLQAAQMGDAQAADCYVGANLNNWPGLLDNPQWVSDYKSNALDLATSSIQQGDWAMVNLMAGAYNGGARSSNMLSQLTGTSTTQAYTLAKLMSLGQPSGTATSNRAGNNLTNLAGQLTPDQIQAADTQAQTMYQQYFGNTPRQPGQVGNTMRSCQGGPQ